MKKYLIASSSVLALPLMALAQGANNNLNDVFSNLNDVLGSLLALFIAIAVIVFVYALIKYISKAGSEDDRKTALHQMVWGVIIIAVMLSVWGLVNLVTNTAELNNVPSEIPTLPSI